MIKLQADTIDGVYEVSAADPCAILYLDIDDFINDLATLKDGETILFVGSDEDAEKIREDYNITECSNSSIQGETK